MDSGFWNRKRISGFLVLYSELHKQNFPGFWSPQAKFSQITDSRFQIPEGFANFLMGRCLSAVCRKTKILCTETRRVSRRQIFQATTFIRPSNSLNIDTLDLPAIYCSRVQEATRYNWLNISNFGTS